MIFVTTAFAFVFVFTFFETFVYWRDGRRAQQNSEIVQNLLETKIDDVVELMAQPEGENEEEMPPEVQQTSFLQPIRELTGNDDIVAYISIPGTNVGNAVVQGADNEFYLYNDIFGNANVNGALFMDYRNNPDFTNPNTIIYGHNMRNGTMFHNLRYYVNQAFFAAHPHIIILKEYEILVYEIFATFETNVDFYYIQVDFQTQAEFAALIEEITRRRRFDTGVTASQYDRILILSTCTNVRYDTRSVVAARLMQ